MIPFLPMTVALLAGTAFFLKKKKGGMTPARLAVYQNAISNERDPEKLRMLAASFKSEGLDAEADMLEKRARLRELPKETKEARRAAFKQAMNSTNVDAIMGMAKAYESEGATGAAETLRKYAMGLGKAAE